MAVVRVALVAVVSSVVAVAVSKWLLLLSYFVCFLCRCAAVAAVVMAVCARVSLCVCAWVRACVHACARACVRVRRSRLKCQFKIFPKLIVWLIV